MKVVFLTSITGSIVARRGDIRDIDYDQAKRFIKAGICREHISSTIKEETTSIISERKRGRKPRIEVR